MLNRSVASELLRILPAEQVDAMLQSTNTITILPSSVQSVVMASFGTSYNLQIKIIIEFAVAQFPASLLRWAKSPIITAKNRFR